LKLIKYMKIFWFKRIKPPIIGNITNNRWFYWCENCFSIQDLFKKKEWWGL